jgi:hypothetical protein
MMLVMLAICQSPMCVPARVCVCVCADLGGFYGVPPYSSCPPGDAAYSAKCLADPHLSGCNINSCNPALCHEVCSQATPSSSVCVCVGLELDGSVRC